MEPAKLKNTKNGQALIEFVFCLIFLVLLLLGFAEFGMAFWTSHAVSNASREGARIAAVYQDLSKNDSTVHKVVFNYLKKSGLNLEAVVVTNSLPEEIGDEVKVTVTFPYRWLTPLPNFLGVDTLEICRNTTMRYAPYRDFSNPNWPLPPDEPPRLPEFPRSFSEPGFIRN